jgi:hypothetical protein
MKFFYSFIVAVFIGIVFNGCYSHYQGKYYENDYYENRTEVIVIVNQHRVIQDQPHRGLRRYYY